MRNGWIAAAALAAVFCSGCAGGGSTPAAPAATASPVPLGSPPPLGVLGYAVAVSGSSSSTPRSLAEYPNASTSPARTIAENGGTLIRFDPSGTLWSDRIGEFAAYGPDGAPQGTLYNIGALLAFDVSGALYTATCCSVNVYLARPAANGIAPAPVRTIATPGFVCSGAADAAGTVYAAFCVAGIDGRVWTQLAQYAPGASGNATPVVTSTAITGPVAVDRAGNVYAQYQGAIGVWPPGTFGGAPARTLSVAPLIPKDISVDRAGDVYVITGPVAAFTPATTLVYYAAGSATPATLQSGMLQSVAAVP